MVGLARRCSGGRAVGIWRHEDVLQAPFKQSGRAVIEIGGLPDWIDDARAEHRCG